MTFAVDWALKTNYLSIYLSVGQIPIFPVVKKDLTFIHLGNDSYVDSLVNFEKLRMIAKEIRHTANMCSARYVSSTSRDHCDAVVWQHALRLSGDARNALYRSVHYW